MFFPYREDVAKVCQELQLSAYAEQIAEEMGASSQRGARFEQFLGWYRSTLDDEMAASSKASTSSTGETTSSSVGAAGSDILDQELMEIDKLTFPVMSGIVLPDHARTPQKPVAQDDPKSAVESDGTSADQDIAKRVVQDLISSVDMNAMDLSDLATKVSWSVIMVNSERTAEYQGIQLNLMGSTSTFVCIMHIMRLPSSQNDTSSIALR